MYTITYDDFKLACEDYHVKILEANLQGKSFIVEADVDTHYDEAQERDYSPFLSLCSYLACTQATLKILDWIFKPNAYKMEVRL